MKRLLKDPEELCCPLSYELMEDPVVAADGFTYERSWVEEAFKRAPGKSPMTGQPIETTVPQKARTKCNEMYNYCIYDYLSCLRTENHIISCQA